MLLYNTDKQQNVFKSNPLVKQSQLVFVMFKYTEL